MLNLTSTCFPPLSEAQRIRGTVNPDRRVNFLYQGRRIGEVAALRLRGHAAVGSGLPACRRRLRDRPGTSRRRRLQTRSGAAPRVVDRDARRRQPYRASAPGLEARDRALSPRKRCGARIRRGGRAAARHTSTEPPSSERSRKPGAWSATRGTSSATSKRWVSPSARSEERALRRGRDDRARRRGPAAESRR
jgi:hypothetical protein